MKELNDKELLRVRLRFLDLIKSFFTSSPDAERLSRWRGTFAAIVKDQVTPEIDKAVRELNNQLTDKKLEQLQDEYYSLFIDPFGDNHLNLMASHYIDGRNHGETLIAIRQLFFDNNISVDESVNQPEDTLPIMLDALTTLVEQEKNGENTTEAQTELVVNFLIPCIKLISKESLDNEVSEFYDACFSFCKGYLSLEKNLTV